MSFKPIGEVFTVACDAKRPFVSIHCGRTEIEKHFGTDGSDLRVIYPCSLSTKHQYSPGGKDQINLIAYGFVEAKRFIENPRILSAIRSFNIRLMQKGGCAYGRYHCMSLADRLIQDLGASG